MCTPKHTRLAQMILHAQGLILHARNPVDRILQDAGDRPVVLGRTDQDAIGGADRSGEVSLTGAGNPALSCACRASAALKDFLRSEPQMQTTLTGSAMIILAETEGYM
jgi:hypothetical protein